MKIRRKLKYIRKRVTECLLKVGNMLDESDDEYTNTYIEALHTELVGADDMLDCLGAPEYHGKWSGKAKFIEIEKKDARNLTGEGRRI